jgi:hypothetical protein
MRTPAIGLSDAAQKAFTDARVNTSEKTGIDNPNTSGRSKQFVLEPFRDQSRLSDAARLELGLL